MGELHDNGSCEVARVTLGALLVAGVFFWRRMLMKQQSLGAMCVAVCSSNRWFLLAAMLIKQQSLVAVCVAVWSWNDPPQHTPCNHTGSPKPAHHSTTGSPSVCLARRFLLHPMCSVVSCGMLQCHEVCGFECDAACHSATMRVAPAFSHHTHSPTIHPPHTE